MLVQNKWNSKLYKILSDDGKVVKLKRTTDGSEFEISKSEFNFSYRNIEHGL